MVGVEHSQCPRGLPTERTLQGADLRQILRDTEWRQQIQGELGCKRPLD